MDAADLAAALVARAVDRGQAVVRCDAGTPVAEIRRSVRAAARERGIRIRTGMVDDVLAVAMADAAIWSDSAERMRQKLAAPAAPGVVA